MNRKKICSIVTGVMLVTLVVAALPTQAESPRQVYDSQQFFRRWLRLALTRWNRWHLSLCCLNVQTGVRPV